MNQLLIVATCLAGFVYECYHFRRSRNIRQFVPIVLFYLAALSVSIMFLLKIPIPNPLTFIQFVFKPLSDQLNAWLGSS